MKEILEAFRQIVRSQRVASRASEKEVGLSAAQLLALHRLASGPAPSLNELAQRTHTHQSSASVVISKLVDRGLVVRRRARNDARRIELALTPAARKLLRRSPYSANDRLVDALNAMPRREVQQLAVLLKKAVVSAGLDSNESHPSD